MQCRLSVDNHAIYVAGQLTFATINEAIQQSWLLVDLLTNSKVVINLSRVERCDSAGIAMLIEWMQMAHRHNSTILFQEIPPKISELIELANLASVLSTTPNEPN